MLALLFGGRQRAAAQFVGRADRARDARRFAESARLYEKALRLDPSNAPIHVQCGHMLKEAGRLNAAERHYLEASRLVPDDPDLALQLGHLYRRAGRLAECEQAYRKALNLWPQWPEPARELADLYRRGWRGRVKRFDRPDDVKLDLAGSVPGGTFEEAPLTELPDLRGLLALEIVPCADRDLMQAGGERFEISHLGREERTLWGPMKTLRGVEAIRGWCSSAIPIQVVEIVLNGLTVHKGPVKGPYALKYEVDRARLKKYVFNVWLDLSPFEPGKYSAEIRLVDAAGGIRSHDSDIVIAEALREADFPGCDALVDAASLFPGRPLRDQVNERPSVVRPAARTLFATPPKTILVMRTDQLGDMISSIPAMRRLREIFPRARIVGLLTAANIDFARTLDLFDETLLVDFPDDAVRRRRIMDLADQEKLRLRLAPYRFDLAIDLAESNVSRPLLPLSGAPVLFGFRDRDFAYLTAGYEGNTHDRLNHMEMVPHSTKVLALVERLGTLVKGNADLVRRTDIGRDELAHFGLSLEDRFLVLHCGARLEYSRWPYFNDLARMLLERTDFKVVMMADGPEVRATLPVDLLDSARLQVVDGILPFDQFDALLSHCAGFVGNDSGPKHLASVRGAHVVSIHMARNNWSEWGQEHSGLIVSRKVPCAGCALYYDAEECGAEFACIGNIRPQEVFDALMSLVGKSPSPRPIATWVDAT